MYFLLLLLALAAIAAIIIGIRCYVHYRYRYRELLKRDKPLSLLRGTFDDGLAQVLIAFLIAILVWFATFVALAIFAGDTPLFSYHVTNMSSDSQVVIFEEQTDDGYIVTVDGKEYVCDRLVISNDVDALQVVYVDCEWSSELMRFFMAGLIPLEDDVYELHIPANYLKPAN